MDQHWKLLNVVMADKKSRATLEYKIHFYRKRNGWYDEIRYDSHEIKKGRKVLAPHLHIKIATPFKNPIQGEAELRKIVDSFLLMLEEFIT